MINPSAVLHGPRDLRVEDRPRAEPGPGQVLVEVGAVGICGSDVHYYDHGRIGPYVVEQPMTVGHEAAGTIIGVGDGVARSRIGEMVALEPGVPCGLCAQCRAGRYNLCPDVVFLATPPVHGAITRYLAIDERFAHAAPAGLSLEQAAMAEPVSVGLWAVQKARVRAGDRVLVTGAGPIGLLAAQVARALGAATVTVTDLNPFRLDVATGLGLRVEPVSSPGTSSFDVLLECSGAQAALTAGMARMAPAGRVVLIGMGQDEVVIDVPLVQGRELSLTGIFRYANSYPAALGLIARGAVDVDSVITHRFPMEQTEDALTLARRDPDSLKAIVHPVG